jgi:hypothetical protein
MSRFEHIYDNALFPSAEDFHAWRDTQTFSAVSSDPVEAECACISLYINALIESSSKLLAWPIHVHKSEETGYFIGFGETVLVRMLYTTIADPPHPRLPAERPDRPKEKRSWIDLFLFGKFQSSAEDDDAGNGLELEWTKLALNKVKQHLLLLNAPGVKRFDRNELILNTLVPHPNLDMRVAVDLLGIYLNKESADSRYFRLFDAITFVYDSLTIPRALSKRTS